MHILLTDILTCPRCGPEFGLILLADRIDERRVVEGRLGCANCREQYPVRGGTLDVRLPGFVPPAENDVSAAGGVDAQEAAVRLAALLGLADAQGTVLVAGPGAAVAGGMAALVPGVQVVALTAAPGDAAGAPGVSPMVGAVVPLPFRGGKLRGVALTGGGDEAALREGLRVLAPGARLVVEHAALGTAAALQALGAQVMLDQEGVVVARAVGTPVQLGINALR
jgi:uncharacterized protein YbaR (Trm112 family)